MCRASDGATVTDVRRATVCLLVGLGACARSRVAVRDGGSDARADVRSGDSSGGTDARVRDASDARSTDASPDAGACDQDGDGHAALACGGDDCDDGRAEVHPGAEEVCDYLDDGGCDSTNDGTPVTWI